jgi:hypothetical protein
MNKALLFFVHTRIRRSSYILKKWCHLNQKGFCGLKKSFVHEAKLKNSFIHSMKPEKDFDL